MLIDYKTYGSKCSNRNRLMSNAQHTSGTRSVDSILQELFSFHRFGIKPGLENITALLDILGNPHRKLRTIHVAGTNGKGTVCSALASVLTEAGYTVGLYTSPHILRFNERIRIDGVEISDDDIARYADAIIPATRSIKGTFFEATTAMAFAYFAERNVDVAVIETGMGGRLDSTNIVEPLLSVITAIDFDHTHYLGSTLPAIATEKAGIIKRGVPALIGEARAALRPVFADKAAEVEAPLVFLDDICTVAPVHYNPDFSIDTTIDTGEESYQLRIPVPGEHTARNIAIAVCALEMLRASLPHTSEDVQCGVAHIRANTGLRGRIELLQQEPPVVIDVAHNSAGMQALTATLRSAGLSGNRWTAVLAAMEDKDISTMAEVLAPLVRDVIATAPSIERAMKPEELAERVRCAGVEHVRAIARVADAVDEALRSGGPVLIAGSFYLADEALTHWQQSRPAAAENLQ